MVSYRYDPLTPGLFPKVMGDVDIKSENVVAYELGYRAQANKRLAWDVALFYNKYRNLTGLYNDDPQPEDDYWIVPIYLHNNGDGDTYGFELTTSWQATPQWKLGGSYTFLAFDESYAIPVGRYGTPGLGSVLADPRNQIRLQSYWNFAPKWQLDAFLRYVDQLMNNGTPSYITMDLRLGWQARKNLEFSVVGQNLFAPHHQEYYISPEFGEPTCEINRAIFAKMTWTR